METDKSKFYVPSIEEFHIGFEYEFHGMTVGGLVLLDTVDNTSETVSEPGLKVWMKEKVILDPVFGRKLYDIEAMIGSDQIRVKYLDREDIESLGFELTGDRYIRRGCVIMLNDGLVHILIAHPSLHTIFDGAIRNKVALKRILKMIGV